MGVIKWQEISDKRSNQLLNRIAKLRQMTDEELEKEYNNTKEELKRTTDKKKRQELTEDLELIYDERKFREQDRKEGRYDPILMSKSEAKEKEAEKKSEEKKIEEKKGGRWGWGILLELLRPEPIPPIWRR